MWAGAVVSVLGGVTGFLLQDEIREEVDRRIARQGGDTGGLDPDIFVAIGVAAGVISALIGATLWIVHAVFTGRGRPWARVSGTLLFAIGALLFLAGLAQPAPALSRGAGLLQQLVGLIAVVLIWRGPSGSFFDDRERARRGY